MITISLRLRRDQTFKINPCIVDIFIGISLIENCKKKPEREREGGGEIGS